MMNIQMKYQREIDRLEKEIRSMKKQILLRQEKNVYGKKQRTIKVCYNRTKLHILTTYLFIFNSFSDHLLICTVMF